MERILLALSLILAAAAPSFEQDEQLLQEYLADPAQRRAQLDREEANGLRIMNVAAHPDDEDGPSLTFLHRRYGYRVHIVYATRGEGGQNEIGPELGDELGVIRSHECQAAAEGYGASISFLNALDFGYSKTAEETLEHWDFETLVQRMMTEIRWFRPDVVLTHHTPGEGHGQHRATSLILREACIRVRQLDETELPLLLERTEDTDGEDVVGIDAGQPVEGLPWTYAGLAYVALRRHRSQGMALGDVPTGANVKHYHAAPGQALASAVPIWSSSNSPWARDRLDTLLPPPSERRRAADQLLPGSRADMVVPSTWSRMRPIPLDRPGAYGSGVLTVSSSFGVERAVVLGPLPEGILATVLPIHGERPWSATDQSVDEVAVAFFAGPKATPDQPASAYLRTRSTVADSLDILLYREGGGETRRRVSVPPRLPRAHLEVLSDLPPLLPGAPTTIEVAWWGERAGLLEVRGSAGLTVEQQAQAFRVMDEKPRTRVTLTPDADATSTVEVTFRHPLLTRTLTFPVLHLTYPKQPRVGFIEGVDGSLKRSLENSGLEVVPIDDVAQDLSGFATILVDVRAYLVRDDLRQHNDRLLDYVRNGGHLVVQYQKTDEWNVDDGSPWPPADLLLSHDRVVDENAAVTPEHPEHPFWHFPHELRAGDWDGWVQERGLYFPTRWDAAFTSLVSMHDKGESPLHGSILVGDFGAGHYTYTSLGWYRQLRAAVPGAYRAFFNLLFWPQAND